MSPPAKRPPKCQIHTPTEDVITLSFIVPAYNEESGLGATLDAIRHAASATGEPYEVIVVDDGSLDTVGLRAAISTHPVRRPARPWRGGRSRH